jgi:hypothetical protein
MHGAELAEVIRVANFKPHALAGVGEVLRIASYDGEGMNVVVAAELRRPFDDGVRLENAAIAKLDIVAYDGGRPDANTGAQSSRR